MNKLLMGQQMFSQLLKQDLVQWNPSLALVLLSQQLK